MKQKCKHCGTRYTSGEGDGDFCCSGCAQVYNLIHSGGLEDFYAHQDGVGLPVRKRTAWAPDLVFVNQLQRESEEADVRSCELTLGLQGLTCMGCAWLVETVARRHPGVDSCHVALSSSQMHLTWRRGEVDLSDLANELNRYGYLVTQSNFGGVSISPLLLRLILSSVFSLNVGVVLSLTHFEVGGEGMHQLYSLLVLISLVFVLYVGAQVFFQPAWRAICLGRWHSDLVPSSAFLALFGWCLVASFSGASALLPVVLYLGLVNLFLFSRWVREAWLLRSHD